MSAFFGIVNLNEQPVDSSTILKMQGALSAYGTDGSTIWQKDNVAFGHQMLFTTPESLQEILPFHESDLDIVITCNARIDNRKELFDTLSLPNELRDDISDSSLILLTYKKWGESCAQYLLGDFGIVIWDNRNKKIVCLTDHMAIHQIYYFYQDSQFIFASAVKAVLEAPNVPRQLNEEKLAKLFFINHYLQEKEETFFKNIFKVPPATVMCITKGRKSEFNYWRPDLTKTLPYKSDSEWLEAFRDLMFKVVGCRLRSAFPVAAMLSGGLDSSSITAVAATILKEQGKQLTAVSAIVPDHLKHKIEDERPFIDIFKTWENIDIHYVSDEWRGPFDDIEKLVSDFSTPYFTSRHFQYSALTMAARNEGARIILGGEGGEFGPTSHGKGYLPQLLCNWDWIRLFEEVRGLSKREGRSVWWITARHVLLPFIPDFLLSNKPNLSLNSYQNTIPLRKHYMEQVLKGRWQKMLQREKKFFKYPTNFKQDQLATILICQGYAGDIPYRGTEQINHLMPFLDRRILEFCLAAPEDLFIRQGWKRYMIRAGLDQVLPHEIQHRTSKKPFCPDYDVRYRRDKVKALNLLSSIPDDSPMKNLIDIEKIVQLINEREQDSTTALFTAPFGIYVSMFLKEFL